MRFREIPDWVWNLTRQERECLQALVEAYPRALSDAFLESSVVHKEHAATRNPIIVPVLVSRLRKKLPAGGIERVAGTGYRLSVAAVAHL